MSPQSSHATPYEFLLKTLSGRHWKKLGTQRRAGVAFPLFSGYSKNSTGIGEIPDLKLLIDWCKSCGMSLLQLLPLNDVGLRFTPYDAESTFALEPAYLSPLALKETDMKPFQKEIAALQARFPFRGLRVDYRIKKAKLEFFSRVFEAAGRTPSAALQDFIRQNVFWIRDYALFKVIQETSGGKGWEDWEPALKNRDKAALEAFEQKQARRILFYQWLQYQLFAQFREVREHAARQGVFIMGDLPFLVSRDSADVWARPDYFRLDLASGAPPDLYFALGQRWGMPPYRWEAMDAHGDDYLIEKLRTAQQLYDLYRIDHVVGIFRVWTIRLSEPAEHHGFHGVFDPADEGKWEDQGRRILARMIRHADMLPCAEDLGTVPDCAVRVLEEFGIPGMDVQRWRRDWGKTYDFLPPESYRPVSIGLVSTHDMGAFKTWWDEETGTVDEARFRRSCEQQGLSFDVLKERLFEPSPSAGRLRWRREVSDVSRLLEVLGLPGEQAGAFIDFYCSSFDERLKFFRYLQPDAPDAAVPAQSTPALIESALRRLLQSRSIFSIQMFSDLLSLDAEIHDLADHLKVNFPGTFGEQNWSARLPWPLETLLKHPLNKKLKALHRAAGRV